MGVFYANGPNALAGTVVSGGAATGAGQILEATAAGAASWAAAPAAASQVLTSTGAGAEGWAAGMVLQAATPVAGFALQNATPTIISWTAPNDGQLHRVLLIAATRVTGAETGGGVNGNGTDPSAAGFSKSVLAAGLAAGFQNAAPVTYTIQAGSTFTVAQAAALTAGAAVVWAEIWGS